MRRLISTGNLPRSLLRRLKSSLIRRFIRSVIGRSVRRLIGRGSYTVFPRVIKRKLLTGIFNGVLQVVKKILLHLESLHVDARVQVTILLGLL